MKSITFDNKHFKLFEKLKINCSECVGLCCVALYCMKTDGFPADKEARVPCKHLALDYRCDIHSNLIDRNYKGCLAYDCFGAGQKTTQLCSSNGTWRDGPQQATKIYDIFKLVFQMHQMLWYLIQASSLTLNDDINITIDDLISENEQMLTDSLDCISESNVNNYRMKVNRVLKQVSASIWGNSSNGVHSQNYLGRDFKKANLDGRDFSMSLMIAANLEGCSLKKACFLGVDMRDANFKNADLSKSVFLTQMQINSAKGSLSTKIPLYLSRPVTWRE